jgi:hypothetical protein
MEPGPQITDIAHVTQLAVTPISLLAGMGIIVNSKPPRVAQTLQHQNVFPNLQCGSLLR